MSALCLLLLTLFTSVGFAQSTTFGAIKGTIVDTSDIPIPGVIVELLKASDSTPAQQATTNESGHFLFEEVSPGTYEVTISREGFASVKYVNIQVSPGAVAVINTSLIFEDANELEMVVRENRSPRFVSKRMSTSSDTITRDQKRRIPSRSRSRPSRIRFGPGDTSCAWDCVGLDHTVTALYEVILTEHFEEILATVHLRYEAPGADRDAQEMIVPFPAHALREIEALTGQDARIAYAAATFAEKLRKSPHVEELLMDTLIAYTQRAERGTADDAELVQLMKTARRLGIDNGYHHRLAR